MLTPFLTWVRVGHALTPAHHLGVMIAARHLARSLAEYGSPELQTAARLRAAGHNPHRLAQRYNLTAAQAANLDTLAAALTATQQADET